MKAALYKNYGGPEVLQIQQIKKPTPKANEVLIKVIATSVTAGDVRMRSFNVPTWQWVFARLYLGVLRPKRTILGMELSGVIEAVGENVTRFKIGDEVFASTLNDGFGAYAEYKCFPETGPIAIKPVNLTFVESATLPIGAGTALRFMMKGNLKGRKNVLIYGASGSVGTYAIQLSKYFGASVTGVCSTNNIDFVRSLGVYEVIDYSKKDIVQWGKKYDLIFDAVGKAPKSKLKSLLTDDGVLLSVATDPGKINQADLQLISQLAESNHLGSILGCVYQLEDIAEAHRFVDKGKKKGNLGVMIN